MLIEKNIVAYSLRILAPQMIGTKTHAEGEELVLEFWKNKKIVQKGE